jgi:hypothetical protein
VVREQRIHIRVKKKRVKSDKNLSKPQMSLDQSSRSITSSIKIQDRLTHNICECDTATPRQRQRTQKRAVLRDHLRYSPFCHIGLSVPYGVHPSLAHTYSTNAPLLGQHQQQQQQQQQQQRASDLNSYASWTWIIDAHLKTYIRPTQQTAQSVTEAPYSRRFDNLFYFYFPAIFIQSRKKQRGYKRSPTVGSRPLLLR